MLRRTQLAVLAASLAALGASTALAQNLIVKGAINAPGTTCTTPGGCAHSLMGRVGIGTPNPQALLDVGGSGSVRLSGVGQLSGYGGVELVNNGGRLEIAAPQYWLMNPAGTVPYVVIDQSGDMGLGQPAPAGTRLFVPGPARIQGPLTVATTMSTGPLTVAGPLTTGSVGVTGAGGYAIDLAVNGRIQTGDATGGGGIWLSNGQNMFVGQNGSNVGFWTSGAGWGALQITNGGNVGIGTAAPAAKLDVVGDVHSSGRYGGTFMNGATTGGIGGALVAHSGNSVSADWSSTGLHFYVDTTMVKTFVINHPTDPNRYLIHSAIEGPEWGAVYYRGEAKLADGVARVKLPDYFEALTKKENRTVLLTCKNGWSPLYYEEIKDGVLTVRLAGGVHQAVAARAGAGQLGMGDGSQVFSWEVKAERKGGTLAVEPLKSDVDVRGDGPYTYYTERSHR